MAAAVTTRPGGTGNPAATRSPRTAALPPTAARSAVPAAANLMITGLVSTIHPIDSVANYCDATLLVGCRTTANGRGAVLPMRPDLLKGHLDTLLLAVLEAGPQHGYAVIETLRTGSDGALALPTGTVYPALHRLERAGLITSEWQTVG